MKKLFLASQSPRRAELLSILGYNFEIIKLECDEIYPSTLKIDEISSFLSKLKADNYTALKENEILLTADTIVALENEILEKPKNKAEAKKMLEKLSGKKHRVYTSISIKTTDEIFTETDIAEVEFDLITDEEIDFYVNSHNPLDKAGAYGIQDWIGLAKIKKITGNYYTIMGLPTAIVYKKLNSLGVKRSFR